MIPTPLRKRQTDSTRTQALRSNDATRPYHVLGPRALCHMLGKGGPAWLYHACSRHDQRQGPCAMNTSWQLSISNERSTGRHPRPSALTTRQRRPHIHQIQAYARRPISRSSIRYAHPWVATEPSSAPRARAAAPHPQQACPPYPIARSDRLTRHSRAFRTAIRSHPRKRVRLLRSFAMSRISFRGAASAWRNSSNPEPEPSSVASGDGDGSGDGDASIGGGKGGRWVWWQRRRRRRERDLLVYA